MMSSKFPLPENCCTIQSKWFKVSTNNYDSLILFLNLSSWLLPQKHFYVIIRNQMHIELTCRIQLPVLLPNFISKLALIQGLKQLTGIFTISYHLKLQIWQRRTYIKKKLCIIYQEHNMNLIKDFEKKKRVNYILSWLQKPKAKSRSTQLNFPR